MFIFIGAHMAKIKRNKNWENLEEKEVKFGNLRSKF